MNSKKMALFTTLAFWVVILWSPSLANARSVTETRSLSTLCKVWGLMKYYHPKVIKGVVDWDEVLVKAVPRFLQAADKESLNLEIGELIRSGGGINYLDFDRSIPDIPVKDHISFGWIDNEPLLDWYTRLQLKVLLNNGVSGASHYVVYQQWIGIPLFDNEKPYAEPEFPSEEIRLLALFRYWNIYNYLSPYRDVIEGDWEEILEKYIPAVRNATTALEYNFAMRKFTAATDDGHASFGARAFNNYWGILFPPFESRFVEGKTVISRIFTNLMTGSGEILPGDVIIGFEGMEIEKLRDFTLQFMPGSNIAFKHYNAGFYMFTGDTDSCKLTVLRNGDIHTVTLPRYPYSALLNEMIAEAGPVREILAGNIGYINMERLEKEQVEGIFTDPAMMNTKGIIFDLRNYPNETVWLIMEYMVPQPVITALIKYPLPEKPGEFDTRNSSWFGRAGGYEDYYKGRVVILCDERSISQSEYSVMALQKCPDAVTVGSQTAGADGNVTHIRLPGNIYTNITGIGVFYPDGTPTQRVGVRIDHTVRPTIEGLRQEKDEVLEFALNLIRNGK